MRSSARRPSSTPPAARGGPPPSMRRQSSREPQRRRLEPRDPCEVGEQAVERVIAVAEDVALTDDAALVGEQVAAGYVLDIDHIEPAWHVGGDLAEHEAADDRSPARVHVAASEHVTGVDGDEREALRREPERLYLRLVLRVDVRDPEVAGGEQLALVGGLPRRGGPDRRDARRVHDPLDAGAQRLLEQDPGAAHVDVE